jgi:hypothetical protein
MDSDGAGNRRVAVNMHMSGEHRTVGDHHAVSDPAVMSDVRSGHEIAVAADLRDALFLLAGPIDRDAFTNDVVVSNNDLRVASLIGKVLGLTANDGSRKDVIMSPPSVQ